MLPDADPDAFLRDRREARSARPAGNRALTAFTASPIAADRQDVSASKAFTAYPSALAEEAFQGLAGEFVRTIEPHSEADPAAILTQFLVGVGNVIGSGPHVLAEADQHPGRLFVALVGVSSKGRKGSSWGHVRQGLGAVDAEWLQARVQGGLSSGEGLIWSVRDPIEKQEPIRENKRIVGYETVISDPGISDKRLLIVEPELASTLRVMGRDGNTLSAILRQSWDSGDLRVMTKNNPATATDAHVSIIAHCTRDETVRYLDRTEFGNGFANRFLWISVRRSKLLPEGGQLQESDLSRLILRLRHAVDNARRLGQRQIARDAAARELWISIYTDLSQGHPGLAGAVTSRGEAQVMRLALLYALLDSAQEISVPHLRAALALWRYAEQSARFIFGESLGDPLADELLSMLRAKPDGMTRTEIREAFSRNKSSDELGKALTLLQQHGLVDRHEEKGGGPGRPPEVWTAVASYAVNAVNAQTHEGREG